LYSDRCAVDCAAQEGGVERHVVGAVVAVAAGTLRVDDANVVERETGNPGDVGTQLIGPLAASVAEAVSTNIRPAAVSFVIAEIIERPI
jgi:hypothetical protein